MVEAKLLRKKLKNGLIVDKWDLVTIIEKQQAEIEALKAAIISENEACAQILLDSYNTTEPYESISPDWLLTLVDLIDDRVGRVRT